MKRRETITKQHNRHAVLRKNEEEVVKLLGNRWWNMEITKILEENAVIFRLAVAIVGSKMDKGKR